MKPNLLLSMLLLTTGVVNAQMPDNWQWKTLAGTSNPSLDLHYTGANTWYRNGLAASIEKSEDGGQTWKLIKAPDATYTAWSAEHCSFRGNTIYMSNGGSVYKTTNDGNSWTDMSTAFNGGTFIQNPADGKIWKFSGNELLRSTDDGANWTTLTLPNASADDRPVNFTLFSESSGYAFMSIGKLYMSNDGINWTQRQVPTRMWGNELCFFKDVNNGLLFRDNWTDTIFTSSNGGTSWTYKLLPMDKGTRTTAAYAGSNILIGLYNPDLNSNKTKIARSTDGGNTWTYINMQGKPGYIRKIVMKDNNNGLALGDNGSMFSTSDGGASWNALNTFGAYTIEDHDFLDANNGVMAGVKGIWYTHNGGKSYTTAAVSPIDPGVGTEEFYGITYLNASTVLAMGYGGYAYFSTDSGHTFTQGKYTWFIGTFYDVYYHADNHKIFAVGRAADGVKNYTVSTDAGNSWTAAQMPGAFDIKRIYFFNSTLGYAVGSDSLNQFKAAAWKTTDGGVSWLRMTIPGIETGNSSVWDIHFNDAQNGWMVGSKIWKTTDGGSTWSLVTTGLPAAQMRGVYFTDAQHGYVSGTLGYYMSTKDGGSTWTQQNLHSRATLKHFVKAGAVLSLSSDGGGLLTMDGNSGTGVQALEKQAASAVIYPNPYEGNCLCTQGFGSNHNSLQMEVFNLNGQSVKSQLKSLSNGCFELEGLSSGIYLIKVSSEVYQQTFKLIVP